MFDEISSFRTWANQTRYKGQPEGHYESFFQRANHPVRPLAFWIRYTLFAPRARPQAAIGELWTVFFDGETNRHLAAKQEYPLAACAFSPSTFFVKVGDAQLDPGHLSGTIQTRDHTVSWELSFRGESAPLLLLPIRSYDRRIPPAKSLVGLPMAHYNGKLTLDGETIPIEDWVGSQNHNWGARHTDRYAWGQVAGFDTHPESFLEVATAQLRIGPLWTPPVTLIVLRHNGREYALNGLFQSVRARGSFDYFTWRFKSETPRIGIEGILSAPRDAFVGLKYYNPPGGTKTCLNTKIAACTVQIEDKTLGTAEILEAKCRAAFEILTDDRSHCIPVSA